MTVPQLESCASVELDDVLLLSKDDTVDSDRRSSLGPFLDLLFVPTSGPGLAAEELIEGGFADWTGGFDI